MSDFIVTYKVPEKDDARPWGQWETTAVGHLPEEEGGLAFCDKIITVNPGHKLSVQKHLFRKEDWTIVSGKVTVYIGDAPDSMKPYPLKADESIHIPCGAWHRVENTGTTPATFKERQSGIYLDEKDIIRQPSAEDPRGTDEAALQAIKDYVLAHKLDRHWPCTP